MSLLRRRLERLDQVYLRDYGIDVSEPPGSGAAGGLAGGLAGVGATLVPGFDVVADALSLAERKAGIPALVVAGDVVKEELPEQPPSVTVVSLVERFGAERAWADVAGYVEEVVAGHLR